MPASPILKMTLPLRFNLLQGALLNPLNIAVRSCCCCSGLLFVLLVLLSIVASVVHTYIYLCAFCVVFFKGVVSEALECPMQSTTAWSAGDLGYQDL